METSIALLQDYRYIQSTSYLNAMDLKFVLYALKRILEFILRYANKTP